MIGASSFVIGLVSQGVVLWLYYLAFVLSTVHSFSNFVSLSTFAYDWRCVEHETSFLVQINYCDWFAWCMVTAVALLLLLNDKCKPESLQRDGRPGWRIPQTAGCKARTCFVKV